MHRRLVSVVFIFFAAVFFANAQSNEWFWNQKVSKIDFEGLKTVKKSELTGITSTYIDRPFSEDLYNEILDRLYALEFFDDITPYVKHASKNSSDVLLVFEVVERPLIAEINFVGNRKIRNGELREKIKSKTSDIYIEAKILLDERTIRNYYLEKGYTTSTVTHTVKETEKGVVVSFDINEGQNTIIKEIHFSGNTIVSERTLRSKLSMREIGIFGLIHDGAYKPAAIEQDKQKIVMYYKDKGYADASVLDVNIVTNYNADKQRNELILTYIVSEGSLYTYGGMKITGNEVFSEKQLLAETRLKAGNTYNETKFQEDMMAITSKYYENGYMSAQFYPITTKNTDKNEISYEVGIIENSRAHIENIVIKGNTKTKEYVIRREIPIESGDVFSQDSIINAFRNLMNLQYFSSIIPEPGPGSEENLVDLVWTVEEQSTANVQFGLTFTGVTESNALPISLFANVENTNLFGEGRTVSTAVKLASDNQSFELGYGQSWVGDLPIAWSENLAFSHEKTYSSQLFFDSFTGTLEQGALSMSYDNYSATLSSALSRRWYPNYAIITLAGGLTNSLQYNAYDASLNVPVNTGLSFYENRLGLSNSIFTSISVDNRDFMYEPSKGWFANERVAWYGILPSVEKEFFMRSDTKLEGYAKLAQFSFSDFWTFKLVLAGYTGVSFVLPTDKSSLSDSNKLYIDGLINGRGWTGAFASSRGQFMLSNKLELRLPVIPSIIGICGFFDAAYTKPDLKHSLMPKTEDWYFSWGPGVRFLIQQFPLHILFTFRGKVFEDEWHTLPFQLVLSYNIVNR